MKLRTKYHGEIKIEKEEILKFPYGIPGFSDEKQFVILSFNQDAPFFILQSVQTEQLAFVITIPFLFFPNYEFDLDDNTIQQLKIEKKQDVQVYSILTVQNPFEKTTANLQAPVVINRKEMLGKQVILTNTTYQTKHLLTKKVKEEV
ncbi:flagellar assembly protein FliW [Aeribacillus alveayuensis]|uniref:Flagellar assembly factor FliW n=1 Tax=Aeribacillus alveayuensis TaxID=279215 RepID=A0ABT9VME2_9BACI|nr:flagellar assembly factor FliW [Bacillus alveayuensis]